MRGILWLQGLDNLTEFKRVGLLGYCTFVAAGVDEESKVTSLFLLHVHFYWSAISL